MGMERHMGGGFFLVFVSEPPWRACPGLLPPVLKGQEHLCALLPGQMEHSTQRKGDVLNKAGKKRWLFHLPQRGPHTLPCLNQWVGESFLLFRLEKLRKCCAK